MSDFKMVMKVNHIAADSPGTWGDSTIKLYLKTDRFTIKKIEAAIKKVLNYDGEGK